MKRVLFVDDEPQILDGLRDLLRKQRKQWDMVFSVGGSAALQQLELGRFDVVVSDMRMPGIDGAALLQAVKDRHPSTVRIILSGHAERESILKTLPVAHQFLSKPCDADAVRIVIERACALQLMLEDDDIKRVIGSVDRLPSVPHTYLALCSASALPETGLTDLTAIVERDPAMAAKVLQIVNSSYFGLAQKHTSLQQAVSYLGTDLLKGLALTAHVFMSGEQTGIEGFSIESLQAHSMRVARLAQSFLLDHSRAGEAFTAGVVHDIGKLVLAQCAAGPFAEAMRISHATGRPEHEVERELLGTTHGEVGAYLLGLWGLPLSIVEAVANHHQPERIAPTDTLISLHVASALCHASAAEEGDASVGGRLNAKHVETTPWGAELGQWRMLASAARAAGDRIMNADAGSKLRILCVDDEPQILEGLALHLRRRYLPMTATSGAAGLELLAQHPDTAVVISDMRMPGMNGAAFLAQSRLAAPSAVRMLLTGQSDINSAIAAINDGQIFRFLTKPCTPQTLLDATSAAVTQHELIIAEKVLLEQTLRGSIQALVDVLALVNPVSFGRAARIKQLVIELATQTAMSDRWQVEVAAMLSQLGHITLPAATAEKVYYGRELSVDEKQMVNRLPAVTEELLGNIPRMEGVREILRTYASPYRPDGAPRARGTDDVVHQSASLRRRHCVRCAGLVGHRIAATHHRAIARPGREIRSRHPRCPGRLEVPRENCPQPSGAGAVPAHRDDLAEDVHARDGTLLVARGYRITERFLERIRNLAVGAVQESFLVVAE